MRYITEIIQSSSSTGSVTSVAGHTGDVTLTKTDVGLGNVDNTSDVNKPVSAAIQVVLDSKAPVASPLFTGTPAASTATTGTNTNQLATTAFVQASVAGLDTSSGVDVGSFYYFDKDATVSDKCVAFTQRVLLDPALYPELANVIPVSSGSSGSLQATLNNPTPAYSDHFGFSVAISGDYAIVGARDDDTGADDAGSAYIYVRSGTTWSLQSTLNNPTPAIEDYFGYSVAISGDYAIVGAYWDDTTAENAGSAYIYVRSGTTWSLQATLNNPTPADSDHFGITVAISGDYAIVGAVYDDTGADDAGSAYIYVRSGTTWSLQATLNNPTPAAEDRFGNSVSISGDYAIVGADADDTGAENAGSAYIYVRSGTTWSLQATLNNPTPANSDWFGFSVAISGDYAIVGAFLDDTGADDAGSAYIYVRSGTTWSLQATLNNPTPAGTDYFGYSVTISSDYAIVGALQDDKGATDAGSAYIYARSGTTWSLQSTLNNPAPAAGDNFGISVAISGDYAIVGAHSDDTGADGAGSAYIYETTPSNKIVLNPLPSLAEHKTIVRVKP